jgi:hypothetical protein
MTVITQVIDNLEFLLSEANGARSRDQATVTVPANITWPSGTVLGKVTATGKLIKYLDTASDGSQTAVGVLGYHLVGGASPADQKALVFARDCEVIGDRLNGGANVDANGKADLALIGVIVR